MLSSFRRTTLTAVVAVVAALGLTACDDSTGTETTDLPTQEVQEISTKVSEVNVALDQNVGVDGLGSITGAVPTSGIVQAGVTMDASEFERLAERDLPDITGVAPTPSEMAQIMSGPQTNVVPDSLEGTFWEYNFTDGVWENNSSRDGEAPTNGIRFALYDAYSAGAPSSSTEIGWVDLRDNSTSSTDELRVLVQDESANITYVDYTITVDGFDTTDAGTATAVGFVDDGTTQVDFDFSIDISEPDANNDVDVAYDFQIDVPANNFGMRVELTGTTNVDTGEGSASLKVTVEDEGDTLVIELNVAEDGTITGQVLWNGQKAADAQGNETDGVTWVDPDTGDPLPQEEQDALNLIFFAVFFTGFFFAVTVFSVGGAAVFGV